MQVAKPEGSVHARPLWRWTFRSIAELRKALEEYTALVDMQLSRQVGGEGCSDSEAMDTQYRIMAQNREIDRRMVKLFADAPLLARLLHWYYRMGNNVEAEGWRIAAKRCGLSSRRRMCRGRDISRAQFEVLLDLALRELFYTR